MFQKEKMIVIVTCYKDSIKKHKKRLKKFGLDWIGEGQFGGSVAEYVCNKIQTYCSENGLSFQIENNLTKRSKDYRKKYFESHKTFLNKFYFCAYCGKMCKKENVTIDHIVPIAATTAGKGSGMTMKSSFKMQKRLKKRGIYDINSDKNLTVACWTCNRKKSGKSGWLYIQRGRFGKWLVEKPNIFFFVWLIRMGLYISIFVGMCYYVSKLLSK